MSESAIYHEGNRALQDQFGSRALADRLEDVVPPRQPTFRG